MKNSDEVMRSMYSGTLSPILERTSAFFDHDPRDFDSISAYSDSTVADSEFVAQRVAKFEREQSESCNPPTVYNLRIDKIVIDGAKSKSDFEIEKPMKAAVNQILSDFHTSHMSSEKFMTAPSEHKFKKFKKTVSNPRAYIPTAVLVIILITLIIAVPMTLNNRNQNQNDVTTPGTDSTAFPTPLPTALPTVDDQTTLAEETTTGSSPDPDTDTEVPNTTPGTTSTATTPTTTELPHELKFVTRETWLTKGLNISGRYKQITPVSKIILSSTQSDACYDNETCIDFMALRQLHAYPLHDDVLENFLIDASGAVYEGRGFQKEGQTTGESGTSYNSNAVSISFILSESESTPSFVQQESFCDFVHQSIERGSLDGNYVVFKHYALLASYDDTEDDSLSVGACELNWGKPPKIVKRRDWKATQLVARDDAVFRRLIRDIKVVNGDDECDSKESCVELVKAYQESSGEIEYNFVIAGDGFIFEGINFDLASPLDKPSGDMLWILCLGKQTEALNLGLEELMKFAVEMRKLPSSFQSSKAQIKLEL